MSRYTMYDNDETREDEVSPIEVIKAHVPHLTDFAAEINLSRLHNPDTDVADLAVRECSCGKVIDGFYEYVDHLITVLGGEYRRPR